MRVLHVIKSLDPAEGGPPQVAIRLAAAQATLGADVTILHHEPGPGRSDVIDRNRALVPEHKRVEIETVADSSVSPFGRFRRGVPTCLGRADFVHIHGVWTPILRASAHAARASRVPYCVRTFGVLDPWSLGQKRWKKRIALALGYRAMLDRAAFIHALNADEARLMGPLGLKAPVEVVPNGIFPSEVADLPAAGTFLARVPQLRGRRFALFLSRLHYKKGLDILADAWARAATSLPDVDLVVAGPDEGAREDFESRIAARGLAARTHLVGPLFGAQKLAALRDASCFVLPSRQEGFSVAILEALACGLPVVITHDCHFPEVADEEAGVAVALDPARVADGLVRVLSDAAAAERFGTRGRQMVLDRFTWPRVAERMLALYARYGASGEIARRAPSTAHA